MGSPASRVAANLCMEIIEKSAITASTIPTENLETLCWWQFNFLIIKKHSTSTFHDTLNSIDPKISFAIETENNGKISFLETLVTRKKKTVLSPLMFYRKSTHTDRCLDSNSHHEKKHTKLVRDTKNCPTRQQQQSPILTRGSWWGGGGGWVGG